MFREKSLSLIYIAFNTFPNITDVHIFITAEAASLFKILIFLNFRVYLNFPNVYILRMALVPTLALFMYLLSVFS